MALAVDLHSHSSYAGGAGRICLQSVAETMRYKGIQVFSIGDCLYPPWQKEYSDQFDNTSNGLLLHRNSDAHFIRQTEVIITVSLEGHDNRIIAHHIILFPDDKSVQKMIKWMDVKGYKNTIARPFLCCRNASELLESLFQIQAIDPLIEIIPAHILTPDGILGSKNGLNSMSEFYGDFIDNIHAVETGLSADPQMLCQIPSLQDITFVSNSDCHSAALNRIGREFTILQTDVMSYESIINSIRLNKIAMTAEFLPSEGRYYLTGHRADRHHNCTPLYFVDKEPIEYCCPICNKEMLQGVKNRAAYLQDSSIEPKCKPFLHLVPLVEVIAFAMGTKNISGKSVFKHYITCISEFETEIGLWQSTSKKIQELLDNKLPQEIINHIVAVREGKFYFDPAGYDGLYGSLKIHVEHKNEI